VFCREENKAEETFSATTAIAGMLTFALGAYAVVGDERIAAAAAVAAAGLLAIREELHGLVEKITWPELRSGLLLLAMTFIALPIMPADPIGPFGGVNPREVWIIAIVLACVSFIGYAAVKYLGARPGVLLAAAAGGLVSSTAVTVANARRAATNEGSPQLLAAGVSVATAVQADRCDRDLSPGSRAVRRQANRVGNELCRAGGHRHREHPGVRRHLGQSASAAGFKDRRQGGASRSACGRGAGEDRAR
jgi:uncharacterized membrane protein (DUF4010 family)